MDYWERLYLYKKKLLVPRINRLLNWVMGVNFLCGMVFLLTIVYEYGFRISAGEQTVVHGVYHAVWIVYLLTTTLQILFRQEDSPFKFTPWTWILTILLYLTLLPVIFKKPEETTGVYWVGFLPSYILQGSGVVVAFVLSAFGYSGPAVGQAHQSVVDSGRQFPGIHSGGNGVADAASRHLSGNILH